MSKYRWRGIDAQETILCDTSTKIDFFASKVCIQSNHTIWRVSTPQVLKHLLIGNKELELVVNF